MLVHAGAFDSVTLTDIFSRLRAQGVEFISLAEAVADPVYKIDRKPASSEDRTFLEQVAQARNVANPMKDSLIAPEYTVERLSTVCAQTPDHP
jgi:hypothetical protein